MRQVRAYNAIDGHNGSATPPGGSDERTSGASGSAAEDSDVYKTARAQVQLLGLLARLIAEETAIDKTEEETTKSIKG